MGNTKPSRNMGKEYENARADLKKYKKMSQKLCTPCKVKDREELIPTYLTGRIGKVNSMRKNIADRKTKEHQFFNNKNENGKHVSKLMMQHAILQQEIDEISYEAKKIKKVLTGQKIIPHLMTPHQGRRIKHISINYGRREKANYLHYHLITNKCTINYTRCWKERLVISWRRLTNIMKI